jgi:tetratricopeptide (TPR) repeat protein
VAKPDAPKDTWPLAWSFLGRAYLNSGKYEESLAPFDHYLATEPTSDERAKALLHKATALSKTGKLKEAQAAAEEVQQLQKQGRTYGQAWILLGDIAMAQSEHEKASKYYVIPSRMFKDPLVTPIAIEKAAVALRWVKPNAPQISGESYAKTGPPIRRQQIPRGRPPTNGNKFLPDNA